ncbi:MAG: PD-(D/E)XK nuclease family protein [Anaerolineae bacterium]|nr:PD-(D/E)XK nuclease family protein [Anaerolineae bacterium]
MLKHVQHLAWPGVEVQPILEREAHMRQGAAFHRLVQQHVLGLAVEPLVQGEKLARWWASFQAHPPADLPEKRAAEVTVSALVQGVPLIAKYDLVAVEPGVRAVIVDWKTTAQQPRRQHLAEHLQTRIYRYLLARSGLGSLGRYAPGQIEMRYWFADFPEQAERFTYSDMEYAADEQMLNGLVATIAQQTEFPLTPDTRQCRFCRYRSLCDRGREIGDLDTLLATEDALESEVALEAAYELEL